MDVRVPIPKHRPSPLPRLIPADNVKKPIPLPRQTLAKEQLRDSSEITGDSTDGQYHARKSSPERVDSLNKCVSIMKEEPTLVVDSTEDKVKYVAEGTRKATSLFRKNITKRLTLHPSSPTKEDTMQIKVIRSRSLPSEDIFQSISFDSPLSTGNDGAMIERDEETDDENHTSGAPPPVYPPPPLPDESMYDEVQSVISNHSSNHSDSFHSCSISGSHHGSESVYESVSIYTGDNALVHPSKSLCNLNGMETSSINKHPISHIEGESPYLRSDSWSFYDATSSDVFRSVIRSDSTVDMDDTSSSGNIQNKDSMSFVSNRTVSCSSISPSLLSELDALGYISGDDINDDERSSSSPARSSTSQSVCKENELYDNWEPKMISNNPSISLRQKDGRKQPSKSVIIEFDPLYERAVENVLSSDKESDTLLLNTKRDSKSPYGKINRIVKAVILEDFEDNVDRDETSPPVPPRRYDSIPPSAVDNTETAPEYEEPVSVPPRLIPRAPKAESVDLRSYKQDNVVNAQSSMLQKLESVDYSSEDRKKCRRWPSMKRVFKATTSALSPGVIRRNTSISVRRESTLSTFLTVEEDVTRVIERPVVAPQSSLTYSGMVFKVGVGRERQQDYLQRWCILAEDKLTYYSDKSASSVRDVIPLSTILSIHVIMDYKISTDGDCYEVSTVGKGHNLIFGTSGPSERRVWMQKILESLTTVFSMRIMADYTRAGWCFLKEGISGTWASAWLLVHKRTLFYCLSNAAIQEVDLKKARCIVLQESEKEMKVLCTSEKGPLILLDHPGQALYLCMDTASETAAWQKDIRSAAVDNGPNLAQQQLTRDDIPCIVDKCINFVYAHGSMSEGIYRRNGANSSVTRLLEQFRLDAWAVQLSRQDYTEYDVSSVLKRFFRDLPEPLLTTELHGQLCDIAVGKLGKDRLTVYRRALEQLPPINFLTTRKLIGHLHFIHEQHEKNLMPVENLAAIWGPTLMHVQAPESEPMEWSKLETSVVADLITMYTSLFGVDAAERDREKRMQEVLERYHSSISSMPQSKQSGELHVWVYLHSRDSSNCVNITIGPQKLAGEVCTDLCGRLSLPSYELALQEVICSGALVRPLHYTEKVLDTVLRWGYWDDADRKDNCLVLTKNDIIKEVVPLAKPPLAMCGDLQFADQKSKSFKHYLFEFSQAKLCYYNHKKCSIKLNEWKIEDIIWYLGHEPKRNPQLRWTITFIEKNKKNNRTKDSPYFGCAIAGITKEEQLRWMAALLIGEHPHGLLPSPVLLQ